MLLLTGSMLSALGSVIIQRTAALSLNWDPEGFLPQIQDLRKKESERLGEEEKDRWKVPEKET